MKSKKKVVKPRVPRTHAGETWTKAEYFNFIRGALRKAAQRYPVKFQSKLDARRSVQGKRHRYEYQCKHCTGWFVDRDVEVDHIIGAGTLTEYKHLPKFVERLFCEPDNLQVLCKPCHLIKTNKERRK